MYDCDCGPIENAYVRVCVAVINFAVTVTGRLSYQSRLYIVLIHTAIEKNATTGLYPSIILRSLAKLFLVRNRVYDTQANRCCTRMGACLCVCVSALVVGPAIEATSWLVNLETEKCSIPHFAVTAFWVDIAPEFRMRYFSTHVLAFGALYRTYIWRSFDDMLQVHPNSCFVYFLSFFF